MESIKLFDTIKPPSLKPFRLKAYMKLLGQSSKGINFILDNYFNKIIL